ncbi:hypothetical protein FRC11_010519 [Ceratobasidium sp. 423]|nr:hypothetical protein FRC11_010519 [Ceratobasidium sp. 423]
MSEFIFIWMPGTKINIEILAHSGYLLHLHYQHAVKERDTAQATITRLNPEVSVETLEEYIHAEQEYLECGQKLLPEDLFKIEYISKLKHLRSKGEEYEQCSHKGVALGLLAKKITNTDPGLGWAAQQYVDLRLRTNRLIAWDLTELEESYWYTGHKTIGVPLDTTYVNLISNAQTEASSLVTDTYHITSQPNKLLVFDHHDQGTLQSNDLDMGDSDQSDDEAAGELVDAWQSLLNTQEV